MKFAEYAKSKGIKTNRVDNSPLWKGPLVDGITSSLLSRFLVCRERFRVHVMEGLRPKDSFNHRLEFGNMWHICEEHFAKEIQDPTVSRRSKPASWHVELRKYGSYLSHRYPISQEQIEHWYQVVITQFPIYIDYWSKHQKVVNRTPLFSETVFNVLYNLPSKRIVRLRGKWDSVDLIGKGKDAGLWLKENKTKGDINELKIRRQLTFDLQTMLYLVALECEQYQSQSVVYDGQYSMYSSIPISGVIYNVVRRPLSGGKGSIVRHKPTKSNPQGESKKDFYDRLSKIIQESPEDFFMRWEVGISRADIERFKRQFLNPVLEHLCDWWHWQTTGEAPSVADRNNPHWRHPFGVWNPLDEGGSSDLDEYLDTGSVVGLERAKTLFPELEGE